MNSDEENEDIVTEASKILERLDVPCVVATLINSESMRVIDFNMDKWETSATRRGMSVLSDLSHGLRATIAKTGRGDIHYPSIEPVQQPDDHSCGVACIAMLMGLPYEMVAESTSVDCYGMTLFEFKRALSALKIPFEQCVDTTLHFNGTYVLQVPSLNKLAGTHFIIVEVCDQWRWIYDPNDGRPGKKFYTKDSAKLEHENGLGQSLGSYGAVFRVELGGQLDYIRA